ncbi:tripartite motif-containing protein 45 isoform X3 [Mauremys reevesii]|uniref:tripartite motif-containing protein 45 isoform X3 n=1 Tax=Mauremys reevesii TaxID=260615 RepID=UPI00193EEA4A|nr:tripartite motif-containing protein 45 isoform X3 [Mauremys reevesii]
MRYSDEQQQQFGIMSKIPGEVRGLARTRCPLCTELFLAPKILPCLHTFCMACLEQLEPFSVLGFQAEDSDSTSDGSWLQDHHQPLLSVLCPVCDTEVDLPPGGITDLTTDHLAMNEVLLETLQAQGPGMLCDLCVDGEAVKHCPTCKANLCHFCCQAHRRQKKTASHAVVDLEDLKGYSRTEKSILCPSHPSEDLTLFCEQCEQPVCRDCVVGEHRQHPYALTANVIHNHGDSMRDLLKSTQLHVDTLEGALHHIEGVSSAICSRVEAVAGEIRTFADGYIRAIEEHRDRLLKQLEDLKVQKETLLHLQKAQLEQLLMDMRTGVEFTERLLTSGSDLEILITKGVVASRLRKLNKVDYSIHPGVEDGIQFSPHEKAGQCCGYEVFGTILNKAVDPAKCILQGEDLHSARQKQLASFTLLCNDASGEQMGRGGEPIRVTIIHKDKKDCIIKPSVCDRRDGTYHISYIPEELGTYTVCICVKGQHVQGSPFTLTVKNKFRKHQGVFHCCTFCSSGGQKAARCACGGTMPGGYQGCGHGHRGHPGCPHWSCCGRAIENTECSAVPPGENLQRSLLKTVAL